MKVPGHGEGSAGGAEGPVLETPPQTGGAEDVATSCRHHLLSLNGQTFTPSTVVPEGGLGGHWHDA